MLVRAFRVTDKLGNAFLRVSAWAAMSTVEQAAHLKNGLIGLVARHGDRSSRAVGSVSAPHAQQAYDSHTGRRDPPSGADGPARRRSRLKSSVIKDPLLAQNRALSAFAVLLLLALLAFVVWETTNQDNDNTLPPGRGRSVAAGAQQPRPDGAVPDTRPNGHAHPRSAASRRQSCLYPARKRPG